MEYLFLLGRNTKELKSFIDRDVIGQEEAKTNQ